MARHHLHCMLSFGFSSKEHAAGNVGRFGIGFKVTLVALHPP
jgi:hypothetical protein